MQISKPIELDDMEQGSAIWHTFRSKGFGASEANIIAGMSKWSSVVDLWKAKTGKETKEFVMNDAIQHGIDTEPEARQRFTAATNIEVIPKCYISGSHEFVRASLDGVNNKGDIIVEIKCPSKLAIHMKTVRGSIPEYYYPQLQHQLFVTGATTACFWSYVQSMGGFMVAFPPNLAYIEELIARETKLWDCVINDTEPNPDDYPPMIVDMLDVKF